MMVGKKEVVVKVKEGGRSDGCELDGWIKA
jgi:hypothetical protein